MLRSPILHGAQVLLVALLLSASGCHKKPKSDSSTASEASMTAAKAVTPPRPVRPAPRRAASPPTVEAMLPAPSAPRPTTAAKGQAYPILFDRPLRVGMRYRFVIRGQMDKATSVDGKVLAPYSGKSGFFYEAVISVKAVDAKGRATREEHKVVRIQHTQGDKTRDLLAKDTLVLAEAKEGRKLFSVKGKPASKEVAAFLGHLVELDEGAELSTDEVSGPGGPRRPGDVWRVNTNKLLEKYARKLKNKVVLPPPKDVFSRVRLLGAKKIKGLDVLLLTIVIKIDNLISSLPNVKGTAGSMKVEQIGWIPQDPRSVAYERKQKSVLRLEGEARKGTKKLIIRVHTTNTTETSRAPVP